MKYLMMCKVYTDVGGIKQLYHVCPPVRKIIHSLKLVDYLHVQADSPWYNYYITLYGDMGSSAVCGCGIFWSYSLTIFYVFIFFTK